MKWLQKWLLVSIVFFGIGGAAIVHAGNWDEHLGLQTFLNELILDSGVAWLDNGLATFALGYIQHQVYDLLVNERPLHINKVVLQMKKRRGDSTNYLETEEATLMMCAVGGGIALYKTIRLSEEKGGGLGKRFLGLLGAISPDLLEAARLGVMGPERASNAWVAGDACTFHIKPPKWWWYMVDTFDDNVPDLQRRLLLQGLVVVL